LTQAINYTIPLLYFYALQRSSGGACQLCNARDAHAIALTLVVARYSIDSKGV